MRKRMVVAIVLMVGTVAGARQRYVVPVGQEVNVYKNQTRSLFEEALFTVDRHDYLVVQGEKGAFYSVENMQGLQGWVEKRLVRAKAASAIMAFSDATLLRYLDAPEATLVFGTSKLDEIEITLTRSFRDDLSANIDRETVERIAE